MDVVTIKSADVLKTVRGFLGARYKLGGRTVSSGMDCAGLVIAVMTKFDLPKPMNPNTYSRVNRVSFVVDQLDRCMNRVSINRAKPGMVVVMQHHRMNGAHVAVLDSQTKIIEACSVQGGVVRSQINWSLVKNVFAFRGVTY